MPPIPIELPSEGYGSCSVCGAACWRDGEMIRCSECPNKVHLYNWSRTPSLDEIAVRAAEIKQANLDAGVGGNSPRGLVRARFLRLVG